MQYVIDKLAQKIGYKLRYFSQKIFLRGFMLAGGRGVFHGSPITFMGDGLITSHACGFQEDAAFQAAIGAGRKIFIHPLYHVYRLYLSSRLMLGILERYVKSGSEGIRPVFVECGVGEGHTLYTFYHYVAALKRPELLDALQASHFVFMDTFQGVDMSLVPQASLQSRASFIAEAYGGSTADVIRQRFSFIKNLEIVVGSIPASLAQVSNAFIAPDFLHIDMNNPLPEVEATSFFYPKMKAGSVILFDDYSFQTADDQKAALDKLFDGFDVATPITMPTGQGLKLV